MHTEGHPMKSIKREELDRWEQLAETGRHKG
jgi:hypothetical protein